MNCFLIQAERTTITKHPHQSASELIAPLLTSLAHQFGQPTQVILGNALGGGGNIARYCALDANLDVPATTIDSQCCSGLDSIILAAQIIQGGASNLIFSGGVESYSQRPKRLAKQQDGSYVEYLRPAFAPVGDIDMSEAAAILAQQLNITKQAQHIYAQDSHNKALRHRQSDPTARKLSDKLLDRLPTLVGDKTHGLTSASIALEADGGAVVALASEHYLTTHGLAPLAKVLASCQVSGEASQPALVPIKACRQLLASQSLSVSDIDHWQIMEAYAVQAMATISALGIDANLVNTKGGALARGHAIGASGAVLVVEALKAMRPGELGICTIAAGGGLGSAILIQKLSD